MCTLLFLFCFVFSSDVTIYKLASPCILNDKCFNFPAVSNSEFIAALLSVSPAIVKPTHSSLRAELLNHTAGHFYTPSPVSGSVFFFQPDIYQHNETRRGTVCAAFLSRFWETQAAVWEQCSTSSMQSCTHPLGVKINRPAPETRPELGLAIAQLWSSLKRCFVFQKPANYPSWR